MINKTDEELVKLYKEGNEQAFYALQQRYKKYIEHIVHTYYIVDMDCDDVRQYATIGLLNATQGFSGDNAFLPYAHNCIKNAVISEIRKSNADKRKVCFIDMIYSTYVDPLGNVVDKDDAERVKKFIEEGCSEKEKEIINLFIEDHSIKEIAEKVNVDEKAVDNAIQRVKKKIKAGLGD